MSLLKKLQAVADMLGKVVPIVEQVEENNIPEYFLVTLKVPSVAGNLEYFGSVMRTNNCDSIIPSKNQRLDQNLLLLPSSKEGTTIVVYRKNDEIIEAVTGYSISYRNSKKQKVHMGLTKLAFVEEDELEPISEEVAKVYNARPDIIGRIRNCIVEANNNYDEIMQGLDRRKLKR